MFKNNNNLFDIYKENNLHFIVPNFCDCAHKILRKLFVLIEIYKFLNCNIYATRRLYSTKN